MVPDVLLALAGKEITAVINVVEDKHNSDVYLFHATDLYDPYLGSNSSTDISSPPQIPVINISDVSPNDAIF